MRVWIDADACPRLARDQVVKFALKRGFEVVLVAGQAVARPNFACVRLIVVPSGPDAADDYLVEHAVPGELVICSDVPLADRLVKNGVTALDPRGKEFSPQKPSKDHWSTLRLGVSAYHLALLIDTQIRQRPTRYQALIDQTDHRRLVLDAVPLALWIKTRGRAQITGELALAAGDMHPALALQLASALEPLAQGFPQAQRALARAARAVAQQQALRMAASQALSIITGGPGTGKTYTLARIIAVLNQAIPDIRIAMAAPTGKAAQRMKEALQNSFSDAKLSGLVSAELQRLTPVTIHRLLGLGEDQRPRFHARRQLPFDVIVVDEASMLDLNLAKMLFAAVAPRSRLILLGDANQLASVDAGAVLADLQQAPELAQNRVNLVTSRRFDGEKLIGRMASFIQQNERQQDVLQRFEQEIAPAGRLQALPLTPEMPDCIQLQYLPDSPQDPSIDWNGYYSQLMLGFQGYASAVQDYLASECAEQHEAAAVSVFEDYRILAAVRHGRLGLTALNEQMEQRLLAATAQAKQGEWYAGRPVMMTYNDYQLGLSNGDIGICFKRRHEGRMQFSVYFPSLQKWVAAARLPKSIETAYALTIHKSQGSEFRHVAVVLEAHAAQLLSKELIYTAITRAKKAVSLLAAPSALAAAMTVRTARKSGLSAKISQQLQGNDR